MLSPAELKEFEIKDKENIGSITSSRVNYSYPFQPQQLILLFSHDDWEEFIMEWAFFQKSHYQLVTRLGGANDFGVDVACFNSDKGFLGNWDNFQCKHYASSLTPKEAILEIGKLIWHVFNKNVTSPNNYYFFAPKDCGPSLKKLLLNTENLRQKLYEKWDDWCLSKITSTEKVVLSGEFQDFVDSFDFTIFQYKPHIEVIEEHRNTPYFIGRFGGGLLDRPESQKPPIAPLPSESRYIQQLFEAYSDNKKSLIESTNIDQHPQYNRHYGRSRETFYEAESLRIFARDTVPSGTFKSLQDQVYHGVVEVVEDEHEDGFRRVREVIKTAAKLNVSANGLIDVVGIKDLQGICHQLANEDKLIWKNTDE